MSSHEIGKLDKYIEQLMKCEMLEENTIKELCDKMKEQLMDEANVVNIKSPVTVVGDIHGQIYDLYEIFLIGGSCPDTNYLFLGNYVDRGQHSVETFSLLLCLKLRYPNRITLLRGNHETRSITQVYGLYSECVRKYGNANVWKYFTELFDFFSIAALIDEKILAIHGGLSPMFSSLDQLRVLNRFQDIAAEGPLTDLLWSDPDPEKDGFHYSPTRVAGCTFGQNVLKQFLQANKLEHIIRGHQLCMDGYQVLFDNKLSTLWSAPNFCYRCGNIASILELSEDLRERYFNTFGACPESERQRITWDVLKETPDYFS